jgi:cell division septation protein DedD
MTSPDPYNHPLPPQAKKRGNALGMAILIGVIMLMCCGVITVLGAMIGDDESDEGLRAVSTPNATATHAAPAGSKAAVKAVPVPTATSAKPSPSPKATKMTYAKLSAREWRKVAKDPDAYTGKRYVVHGIVSQFDSATGTSTFRADVDAVPHEYSYEYPTNTLLTTRAADLSDLVEGDRFRAEVEVVGGYTYETQIGGTTTVPEVMVDKVTRK